MQQHNQQPSLQDFYSQLQSQGPQQQMQGAEQFQHLRAGEAGEGYARALGFPSLQAYQVAEQIRERQANEQLRSQMYGAREQHMQFQDANNPNLNVLHPDVANQLIQKMYPNAQQTQQPTQGSSGLDMMRQSLGQH